MLQFRFEGGLMQNFLLLWGGQSFVSFRPSAGWMRPTNTMEYNLLYSKFTNLNINLIQNAITEISRIMFDQVSGHHGSAKLTQKINYHN